MILKTVLGDTEVSGDFSVLPHEHICCCSEYLRGIGGYMDSSETERSAIEILSGLEKKYNLGLFIDCTPINLGRDAELLKRVSKGSGVHIVCSTGFYYNDEPVMERLSAETIGEYIVADAKRVNAGVIKAAAESAELTEFNITLLRAAAYAQRRLGLPIVLHTNAVNRNGRKAVEVLLNEGVAAKCIAVGHLSDTDDIEYIGSFADMGCYIALDRLYADTSSEYIDSKVKQILQLCDAGYENMILLSHDDSVFQGFLEKPHITKPRYSYMFKYILPCLERSLAKKISEENPLNMLEQINLQIFTEGTRRNDEIPRRNT